MFKGRVRKPTYDELEEELLNPKLIVMNRPIKIPRFDIAQNIDAVDFNEFDLNNHNLKIMIDKQTQKDYELQNHDAFLEMYDEIDATGSDMGNDEKTTQTKDTYQKILIFTVVLNRQVINQVSHHHLITYHDLYHLQVLKKKNPRKRGLVFSIQGNGTCIEI